MTDTVEVPDEEIDWTTREMRDWFAFDSTDSVMGPARFDAWLAAVEARATRRERLRIAAEIDRTREDDYLQRQGSPLCEQRNDHDCHMAASQASLDWAARIARGGAA